MSLRWRFAMIFAAGTIVATIVVAAAAVWTTARSLESGIDQFLSSRLETIGRLAIPEFPGEEVFALPTFNQAVPRSLRESGRGGRNSNLFPELDSIFQINRADGSLALIVESSPELPFIEPSRSDYRTVEVDDVRYRVGAIEVANGSVVQIARDLTETDAVLTRLRSRIVAIGLALAGLSGLVGWLAARRVVTPIEDLSVAAETIARTRDLSMSIDAGGNDEVGRLGRSFNMMLDALRTSRAQQRRLVEDASHELRTPLTSLRTNIEVLQRNADLDDSETEEILRDVDGELRELSNLVTELVDLATEVDRSDEPVQEVDLGTLVEGVAERARRRTGRTIEVDSRAARVRVKPSMVERAVSNLLDNAHKWSPREAPILVSVLGRKVSVLDSGPGFAEADLPRVFDRFYRSAEARSKPGSGLGLAIVKQLVEAHDGAVYAANRPEGGAEVGFVLGD